MKCYKLLTALRTFFAVVFVIVPVSSFASRKTEEAKFLTPARLYYLSPKIADGNTDILEIDLSSTVKPGKGRSFVESVFTIYDISGHIIFEQKTALNKAKKLQQLSYDGKDTQGHYLPDGLYVFTIKTKDDKNNESSSQPFSLMVDNVPPEIRSVKFVTGNVIVPSSDTNVAISIDGTPEILWEVYAVSAASGKTPVFSQKSNSPQSPPQGWSWNGTDLTGSNIAGGSYALEIRAQDGAGNSAEFALETKLIVSTEGALTLSSELSAVSPNDDGIMDRALLTVSGDPSLLQSFTSTQIMAASVDQNRFTQNVAAIDGNINELYFEGKDQFGFVFKDGMYEIFVQLTTSSGDVYITNKLMFTVDTTPPAIAFAVQTSPHATPVDDPLYFGGEKRTKLTGVFSVSDAQAATELKILYGDQEILNKQLPNSPQPIPFTIPADFQIEEAQQLQDGLYTAILSAQDSAGNKAEHPPIKVFFDTEEKTLELSASAGTVSARKTPLELTAEYSKTGLKETRLAILNGAGKAVRTESLPYYVQSYKWNARNNSNAVVEDGVYSVQFTAVYYNGTEVNKTLSDIVIDSTPPEITEFAPNAKIIQPYQAEAQNAVFSVVQKSSEEDVTWHAEIRNILNEAVFSKDIEALDTFTWNGRAANGEIVPDGDYFYMISAEDAAGNKTERTASFAVDTGIYEDGMVLTINDPLPVIYFSPYSSNLFAISKDKNTAMYQNLLHIRSIARLLKTDESYKITITGHAAKLLRGNAAEREQNEVLIPLSTARAAFVSNALVILGISEDRITVKSAGGSFPAVQNPSAHDIWQNRRVEFEITKGVQRAQENM